jgi:hypothetical protein
MTMKVNTQIKKKEKDQKLIPKQKRKEKHFLMAYK